MKYSQAKELINEDINNICLVLANENKYDLTETISNINISSNYALTLSKTMTSNIQYNIKIGDDFIDLWAQAENNESIASKIITYGKNNYTSAVLLYMGLKYNTNLKLNDIKISCESNYIKTDVNFIDFNLEIDSTNITPPTNENELDINTIYLKNNGDIIYNIPTNIYGYQFKVGGSTINSVSGGESAVAGLTIQHNNNSVIGFSLNESSINTDSGILTTLNLSEPSTGLENIVFSTASGIPISVSYYTDNNKITKMNSSNIFLHYKIDHHNCIKKISWNINYDYLQSTTIQQDFIDACKSSWVNNILIGMK